MIILQKRKLKISLSFVFLSFLTYDSCIISYVNVFLCRIINFYFVFVFINIIPTDIFFKLIFFRDFFLGYLLSNYDSVKYL